MVNIEKLRVVEAFGGIGSFTRALQEEGFDFDVVDYIDINKNAAKCYNAIHSVDYKPQNIKKWDKNIGFNLFLHGSPCVNFSKDGNKSGGKKGSGTKSSLMWESVRIIRKHLPKYVVWENVKNATGYSEFQDYLDELETMGYCNEWFVLNSKYFIPHNRNRVFVLSSLTPFENDQLEEIREQSNNKKKVVNNLRDYIREDYIGKPFVDDKEIIKRVVDDGVPYIKVEQATKQKWIRADIGSLVDVARPGSSTRRGRVPVDGICPTITTKKYICYVNEDLSLRYLTAKEAFLLQGFTEEDYKKCADVGVSEDQIYERAGNSISVPVARLVIKSLLNIS